MKQMVAEYCVVNFKNASGISSLWYRPAIADMVEQTMQHYGLTQLALAQRLSISRRTLAGLVAGAPNVRLQTLYDLAALQGIRFGIFLTADASDRLRQQVPPQGGLLEVVLPLVRQRVYHETVPAFAQRLMAAPNVLYQLERGLLPTLGKATSMITRIPGLGIGWLPADNVTTLNTEAWMTVAALPHPIDFLYQHCGRRVMVDAPEPIAATPDMVCGVCERPNAEWLEPERAYVYAQYGQEEPQCSACHCNFVGSPTVLGRYSNTGSTTRMNQLGGLEGCGLFITEAGATFLVSDAWAVKLRTAKEFPFRTSVLTTNDERDGFALAHMPEAGPCLYIQRMGRAKHRLLRNLILSDKRMGTLVVCGDGDPSMIDLGALARCLDAKQKTDPKVWAQWCQLNLSLTHGSRTPSDSELRTLMDQHPHLWDVQAPLPVNPWVRRYTLLRAR